MKHRLLSVLLIVAVMASAFAGAMTVSVLPAKADLPESEGYLDDLFAEMRIFCPSASLSTFDSIHEQLTDNFDSWLIMIEHKLGSNDWAVVSYAPDMTNLFFYTFYNGEYLFRPRYSSDYYNYNFHSRYGFMIKNGQFYTEPYNTGLGNTNFTTGILSSADYWQWWYCAPSDVTDQRYECWSNQTLRMLKQNGNWSDNTDYIAYMNPNLLNGSYVPPITEYNWFKFQLGERWYITTTDQSYVNNMIQEDETYYVWNLTIMFEDETFDEWYIDSSMMVRLPFAQTFISRQLENVSPSGVYAYDVTEWIIDSNFVNATSVFYQVLMTPGGYFEWLYIAFSDDVVSFVLTEQEKEQTQNNAWTVINNYFENYPSVTIAPQDLASELLGSKAVTGCTGYVKMPSSIYDWCVNNRSSDIIHGDFSTDGYWHYKLDQSGIDSTYASMINWSICNACIIPLPDTDYIKNWLDIDVYNLPVYANTGSDVFDFIGDYNLNDLYTLFDVIILAPSDAFYLCSIYNNVLIDGSYCYSQVSYESPSSNISWTSVGASVQPVFIIGTDSCIQKSQLFVFCDGFSKLYDLATQYCNKRDLWDSSFFDWSMSIFWELETFNGHLFALENEVLGWKLSIQFEKLFDKLDAIGNNMVEPDLSDVDPWYLPLWNWVNRFAPSVNDFSGSIEVMDDTFEDLPAIPQVTDPPVIPTLPGFE